MNKFVSLMTFIAVTAAVFTGAGFSVKKGLEKDSNFELAGSLARQYLATKVSPTQLASSGGGTVLSAQLNSCGVDPSGLPKTGSVVDFLFDQGADISFDSRTVLAGKIGIDDYRGTAEQNVRLLSSLKKGLICLEDNP